MSPHVLICLAAVLFAGALQAQAQDFGLDFDIFELHHRCNNQQFLANACEDDSRIDAECQAFLDGSLFTDLGLDLKKKK